MKYVVVIISDNKNEQLIYPVDDFELDTIRSLSFYNKKYECFSLIEGELIGEDEKTVEVRCDYVYKRVYYGQRVSSKKVKEIVGNDPRYFKTLEMIDHVKDISQSGDLSATYHISEEIEEELKTDCLFVPPLDFFPAVLTKENDITIEEFDPEIKFDYSAIYRDIMMNSSLAELYANNHHRLIYMFSHFFSLLQEMMEEMEDLNVLFELYKFNFNALGYEDKKVINEFLGYFEYFADLDEKGKFLLKEYRKYKNDELQKGQSR